MARDLGAARRGPRCGCSAGVASAWAMIAVTSLVLAGRRRPGGGRRRDVRRRRGRHRRVDARRRRVRRASGAARPDVARPSAWSPPPARSSPTGSSAGCRRPPPASPTRRGGHRCRSRSAGSSPSYACAGFGYVITATYLVLIVRDSDLGRSLEFGRRGASSGRSPTARRGSWNGVAARNGDRSALVAAHGVLAAGVLTTAFAARHAGVLVGGALFGATFVGHRRRRRRSRPPPRTGRSDPGDRRR